MIEKYPSNIPFVQSDGTLSIPALLFLGSLVDAINNAETARDALEARIAALESP